MLYRVDEVARLLQCGHAKVRALVKDKSLEAMNVGTLMRIYERSLRTYLNMGAEEVIVIPDAPKVRS